MPINADHLSPYILPPASDTGEIMLRWEVNPIEVAHLSAIASRGLALAQFHGAKPGELDAIGLIMDLTCVHLNGCPLDFHAMLLSDDLTFFQELVGIRLHVDRLSGKLRGEFSPKFKAKI